jgi:formyltetrahydrofolate deformylase
VSLPSEESKKVAILVSKETHCLDSLLHNYANGNLEMEITQIVSNHPGAGNKAHLHEIPFQQINPTKENNRDEETIKQTIGKMIENY